MKKGGETVPESRRRGFCIAKIVLDVPGQFMGLVDTWRVTMESMTARLDRTRGGNAVDYGEIERETSDKCRKSEREAHRVILIRRRC